MASKRKHQPDQPHWSVLCAETQQILAQIMLRQAGSKESAPSKLSEPEQGPREKEP